MVNSITRLRMAVVSAVIAAISSILMHHTNGPGIKLIVLRTDFNRSSFQSFFLSIFPLRVVVVLWGWWRFGFYIRHGQPFLQLFKLAGIIGVLSLSALILLVSR